MKTKETMRVVSFCLLVALLTGAVVYGAEKVYGQLKTKTPNLAACQNKGVDHLVTIKDSKVTPAHTTGKLCDTLTISNADDVFRFIAFGRHDEHQPYDGVGEKNLSKDQHFTVTMNELGDYKFHDHMHDEVVGTFSVKR